MSTLVCQHSRLIILNLNTESLLQTDIPWSTSYMHSRGTHITQLVLVADDQRVNFHMWGQYAKHGQGAGQGAAASCHFSDTAHDPYEERIPALPDFSTSIAAAHDWQWWRQRCIMSLTILQVQIIWLPGHNLLVKMVWEKCYENSLHETCEVWGWILDC